MGQTVRIGSLAQGERGSALVVALLSLLLLTGLGLALVLTTTSETLISGNYRDGQEALHAADAVAERVMQDLLTVPDWNDILAGGTTSSFVDGPPSGARTLPDGSSVDLAEVLNVATCGHVASCSDAETRAMTIERPWGANNPRWQLYAFGRLADLLPTNTIESPLYVVVMVGDDPSETDDDPLHDGNSGANPGSGVLSLRAEAFGPRAVHRVVELTVARTQDPGRERGYAGQRGQDEQNRRARKSAIQTPGKALTTQELNVATGIMQ
ncbi:MAG: PilX N-terminal domain-containing pilus assembly protein [Acidobacteriota bacterium]